MLINEVADNSPIDFENVDLLDDLRFFMSNDPQFYRKIFYPMISKVRDHVKANKKCSDKVFRKVVDHATAQYCSQYKIPGNEKSVFTDIDRDQLARQIFDQEMTNIKSGHYDQWKLMNC